MFEEDVLENIKNWVLDDSVRFFNDDGIWKRKFGEKKFFDFDMRRIYFIGFFVVCLIRYG